MGKDGKYVKRHHGKLKSKRDRRSRSSSSSSSSGEASDSWLDKLGARIDKTNEELHKNIVNSFELMLSSVATTLVANTEDISNLKKEVETIRNTRTSTAPATGPANSSASVANSSIVSGFVSYLDRRPNQGSGKGGGNVGKGQKQTGGKGGGAGTLYRMRIRITGFVLEDRCHAAARIE